MTGKTTTAAARRTTAPIRRTEIAMRHVYPPCDLVALWTARLHGATEAELARTFRLPLRNVRIRLDLCERLVSVGRELLPPDQVPVAVRVSDLVRVAR
jgi:hypothetical protein